MIAIDSSVLVDLLADGPQADAAEACLRQCLSNGPVVVCDVALAEVCSACLLYTSGQVSVRSHLA